MNGRDHQIDLAIAVEVVLDHPDLDSLIRLERDVCIPCERDTSIGCWCPEMYFVTGVLIGDVLA